MWRRAERPRVGSEALKIEPGGPVEHHDRVRTAAIHLVEEPHAPLSRHVARTLTGLLPIAHGPLPVGAEPSSQPGVG